MFYLDIIEGKTENEMQQQMSLLAVATLGDLTQIGTFLLFVTPPSENCSKLGLF